MLLVLLSRAFELDLFSVLVVSVLFMCFSVLGDGRLYLYVGDLFSNIIALLSSC